MPFHPQGVHYFLLTLCVSLLLLSNALGGWIGVIPYAYAASAASDSVSNVTFGDFVKKGRQDHADTGPFVPPAKGPTPPGIAAAHTKPLALPHPASPAMQPLDHVLESSLLSSNAAGGTPVDLEGSDKQLELVLQPGSLDLSQASVTGGSTPAPASSPTPTPTPLAATPTPSVTASGTPATPSTSSGSSAVQGPFTLQIRQVYGPLRDIVPVLAVWARRRVSRGSTRIAPGWITIMPATTIRWWDASCRRARCKAMVWVWTPMPMWATIPKRRMIRGGTV